MNEEYCSYCGACDWEGACCANCGMPNRIAELEAEVDKVYYAISVGNPYDGKSVCLWRQSGSVCTKIARFQNVEAAMVFATEFHFPLSKSTKQALQQEVSDDSN